MATQPAERDIPAPRPGDLRLAFFRSDTSGHCRRVEGFLAQVLQLFAEVGRALGEAGDRGLLRRDLQPQAAAGEVEGHHQAAGQQRRRHPDERRPGIALHQHAGVLAPALEDVFVLVNGLRLVGVELEAAAPSIPIRPGSRRDFGPTQAWDRPPVEDFPVLIPRHVLDEAVDEARRAPEREVGGVLPAIDRGFFQRELAESAFHYQRQLESREKIMVGVNDFVTDQIADIPILKIDPAVETGQVDQVRALKATRDQGAVDRTLEALRDAGFTEVTFEPIVAEAGLVHGVRLPSGPSADPEPGDQATSARSPLAR